MRKASVVLVGLGFFFLSSSLQAQNAAPGAEVGPGGHPGIFIGNRQAIPNLRTSPPRSVPIQPLVQQDLSGTNSAPVNVLLGFDSLKCQEYVDNYYAGGNGSLGTGPGPNYGVTFSSNAETLSDYVIETTCGTYTSNATNEPSPYNFIFFLSGSAATMDVPAGFTGGFSFYYTAASNPGFINVWSGLNGTGTLLTTLNLPVTGSCSATPQYCVWNPIGVSFSGTAMSVDFGGTENQIAFDNITLGAAVVVNPGKATGSPSDSPVPAPAAIQSASVPAIYTRMSWTINRPVQTNWRLSGTTIAWGIWRLSQIRSAPSGAPITIVIFESSPLLP